MVRNAVCRPAARRCEPNLEHLPFGLVVIVNRFTAANPLALGCILTANKSRRSLDIFRRGSNATHSNYEYRDTRHAILASVTALP